MEKFGEWRDKGTGIYPFLPDKPPITPIPIPLKIALFLKNYVLGPLLAVIRLLLIAIVSVWMLLMGSLFSLAPIPIVRRFFLRYIFAMGSRAILLFAGFWWINAEHAPLRKGRSPASYSWPPGGDIKSGDIIVCNHVSYIDILYLAFRFCPTFTQAFLVPANSPKGLVRPISMLTAILNVFSAPVVDASPFTDTVHLEDLALKAKKEGSGPIVVFPEVTTSNGKTILKTAPLFQNFKIKEITCHVVGFRYNYKDFSPSFTVGNPFFHIFVLCSQLHNSLEVRYLPIAEAPSPQSLTEATPEDEDPFGTQITTLLANVIRLRKVQLTAQDKLGFLAKYELVKNKGYKSNSKKD